MDKLSTFKLDGKDCKVSFVETMQVKEGVECDVYSFVDDDTKDLAIVRVSRGFKTPLQRILKGNRTVEGFLSGKGSLTVRSKGGKTSIHSFDSDTTSKEVGVEIDQIMQWAASSDVDLTFYEICDPPYQEGRFENLPE